jgi:hypothetical protein
MHRGFGEIMEKDLAPVPLAVYLRLHLFSRPGALASYVTGAEIASLILRNVADLYV